MSFFLNIWLCCLILSIGIILHSMVHLMSVCGGEDKLRLTLSVSYFLFPT